MSELVDGGVVSVVGPREPGEDGGIREHDDAGTVGLAQHDRPLAVGVLEVEWIDDDLAEARVVLALHVHHETSGARADRDLHLVGDPHPPRAFEVLLSDEELQFVLEPRALVGVESKVEGRSPPQDDPPRLGERLAKGEPAPNPVRYEEHDRLLIGPALELPACACSTP